MITKELIEKYKEQNPVKYEAKKAYFEAELAKLEKVNNESVEEVKEEPKEVETLAKKIRRLIKK